MERLDKSSKTSPTRVHLPKRKSQGRGTERRSNKVPMEEHTQQPESERHGYWKDKSPRYLYRRRKTTKGPKQTLLPVQSKGTYRQILPKPRSKGRRSIYI